MKKILAIAMALCLLLASCAFAEEITTVTWAEVEPMTAELGIEGVFLIYDQVNVQMFVPTTLYEVELTQEHIDQGMIAYYTDPELTTAVTVSYLDLAGMTEEEYIEALKATEGVENVNQAIFNDIAFITYTVPASGTAVAATITELGNLLEFGFAPVTDENFNTLATIMMASIQSVEVVG